MRQLNIDKKPDEINLKKTLDGAKDKKHRNKLIIHAYNQGYSQYMIARVLGISQPAVNGIIRRGKSG